MNDESHDWEHHFQTQSEFALILTVSVAAILEYRPVGRMLTYVGLFMMEVAHSMPPDDANRLEVLDWAQRCFRYVVLLCVHDCVVCVIMWPRDSYAWQDSGRRRP